jgi:DNA primase
MRLPSVIGAQVEALSALAAEDARIDALIDAAMSGEGLEPEQIATIFAERGWLPPRQEPIKGMGFIFLQDDAAVQEGGSAMAQLVDVIAVLTERPQVERALAEASAQAAFSEAAFAEQQRLRMRLNDVQKGNWI